MHRINFSFVWTSFPKKIAQLKLFWRKHITSLHVTYLLCIWTIFFVLPLFLSALHNTWMCVRACVIYGLKGLNDLFGMPFVDNWSMKLCEQCRDLWSPLLCAGNILCVVYWAVGVTGILNNTLREGEGGWVALFLPLGASCTNTPLNPENHTFSSRFNYNLANQ